MLFLCSERDFFADSGEHLRRDVEERGDVLQVEQINDAGAALHQLDVALAGGGAVEVMITVPVLAENEFADVGTQFHVLQVPAEELLHLFAGDPQHAAGQHGLDGGLRRTAVEEHGVVAHELALEREPRDVRKVVAHARIDILEASFGDVGEPPCGVALAL